MSSRGEKPRIGLNEIARSGDVDLLIEALADPDLRGSAALRLGDLRARRGVPGLLRLLRAKDDLSRNAAVKALGRIGDPSAIPGLLEVAREDEAAGVRTIAVDSLAMLKAPDGIELLAQLAVDPRPCLQGSVRFFGFLRPVSESKLRYTRRWASKRLRQLGAIEAIPTLERASHAVGVRGRIRLRLTIRALTRERARSA